MMKSGLFLPCAEAHIYPFEKVLADIGDEQSILQSLSKVDQNSLKSAKFMGNS